MASIVGHTELVCARRRKCVGKQWCVRMRDLSTHTFDCHAARQTCHCLISANGPMSSHQGTTWLSGPFQLSRLEFRSWQHIKRNWLKYDNDMVMFPIRLLSGEWKVLHIWGLCLHVIIQFTKIENATLSWQFLIRCLASHIYYFNHLYSSSKVVRIKKHTHVCGLNIAPAIQSTCITNIITTNIILSCEVRYLTYILSINNVESAEKKYSP